MVDICLYFQVHQPYRIKRFTVFDIHKQENLDYFDEEQNKDIMKRVSEKCYLPMNNLIKKLIDQTHGKFKCTYSISGTALDQMEQFFPVVLHSFQDLVRTGNIELLAETYYHSLSFLFDENEYRNQIKQHKEKIFQLFNQLPYVFRNTELIYSNRIAQIIHELGFKGMLLEGWDTFLEYHQVNGVNKSSQNNLKLLARNYRLSDDIAFRFSNKEWKEWPLTVDKFINWVKEHEGSAEVINLFMDYETFGEHQWEDCGIFEFMEHFVMEFLPHGNFITPSEAFIKYPTRHQIDVQEWVSWADAERDLSAWVGNSLQDRALESLARLYIIMKEQGAPKEYYKVLQQLSTSDHFYYMCTKFWHDGDVHKYFSPYDSPYDAFIYFMNVLTHFERKILVNEVNTKIV